MIRHVSMLGQKISYFINLNSLILHFSSITSLAYGISFTFSYSFVSPNNTDGQSEEKKYIYIHNIANSIRIGCDPLTT